MAVVRVLRTRDRVWRVEIRDDGLLDLYERGHLLLRRASLDRVGDTLAGRGVTSADLIDD
jgi:hypothetical protein